MKKPRAKKAPALQPLGTIVREGQPGALPVLVQVTPDLQTVPWPTCAVCKGPIEKLSTTYNVKLSRVEIVAACHGKQEERVLAHNRDPLAPPPSVAEFFRT